MSETKCPHQTDCPLAILGQGDGRIEIWPWDTVRAVHDEMGRMQTGIICALSGGMVGFGLAWLLFR